MTDKNIKAACECGWEGHQNDLIGTRSINGKLYCPACEKPFRPFPLRLPETKKTAAPEPVRVRNGGQV